MLSFFFAFALLFFCRWKKFKKNECSERSVWIQHGRGSVRVHGERNDGEQIHMWQLWSSQRVRNSSSNHLQRMWFTYSVQSAHETTRTVRSRVKGRTDGRLERGACYQVVCSPEQGRMLWGGKGARKELKLVIQRISTVLKHTCLF